MCKSHTDVVYLLGNLLFSHSGSFFRVHSNRIVSRPHICHLKIEISSLRVSLGEAKMRRETHAGQSYCSVIRQAWGTVDKDRRMSALLSQTTVC